MMKRRVIRYFGAIVLFALIHSGAVQLGLQMAYVQQNISPVWPPSGIALAVLILFGFRLWPGITLSVLIGSILKGDLPGIAIGMALANTLEAVITVWLLRRLDFHKSLNRIRDVISLVCACGLGTVLSSTLGSATVFHLGGSSAQFSTLWLTWWVGNFLGCLVVTPFLLTCLTADLLNIGRKRLFEGLSLLILLTFVAWYIFGYHFGTRAIHQALIYVIFPFVIWAALRMGVPGTTAAVVFVSGIALFSTVSGRGPFTSGSLNDSLILLQTFMGVVGLISLILASASSERDRAEESLHHRIRGLASLNNASKVFLGNLGKNNTYEIICQLALEYFQLSAVWIERMSDENKDPGPIASALEQPDSHLTLSVLMAIPQVRKAVANAERLGQPCVVDGLKLPSQPLEKPVKSFVALPLQYAGEAMGVLCVVGPQPDMFSGDNLLLMQSYTNLAAVAVQNSWLFDQVRSGSEQLHALSRRLMEIQESERLHLSRELHDESGQILAVLMVRLGLLERDSDFPELVREHVESLKEMVKNVLENLHQIAVKLRPASLDRLGLVIGLQQYVQEFSHQHCIEIQLDVVGEEIGRLPEEDETALFRIVQESLVNVILHAHASRVDILLSRRKGSLVMMIEDNGVGFDPEHPLQENRLGLFGMHERIQILDGCFQVESAPGKGTTIVVEVPYEDASVNSR
jgi:signal transduction histidine kinase